VALALIVALGLATYVQTNYTGDEATRLLHFISFLSAVIASSLSCYIVCSPEIYKGVPLLNKQMENVLPGETSIVAAKRGVYSTTASQGELIQHES
jgi:ABC-type sugar transport system permease subunit